MTEKDWEYFKRQEEKTARAKWQEISRELILENGFFCGESLCNIDPENEFEKDVGIEEVDGKLIVKAECRVCNSYFIGAELPKEYHEFARYYFFGENPNLQEETMLEIPTGTGNRYQVPLSISSSKTQNQ